jgi:hypothetical protein
MEMAGPTYFTPHGGHPPQTDLLTGRAVFTEAEMRPFLTCSSDRVGDEALNEQLKRGGGCGWWE